MEDEQKQTELIALLSAYLDGELSATQVQKVEKLLARTPETRQLLEQLRHISSIVTRLPHEPAPKHLAALVQRDLERDILLGDGNELSQLIGQKHLAWRRFIAAAAILILCASIITIVYRVLFYHPTNGSGSTPIAATDTSAALKNKPILASDPRAADGKLAIADKTGITAPPITPAAPIAGIADPEKIPQPDYQSLHLQFFCRHRDRDKRELEFILAEENIQKLLTNSHNPHQIRYAFFCTIQQLQKFLLLLDQRLTSNLAMVVNPPETMASSANAQTLTINELTVPEIIAYTQISNPQRQWRQALHLHEVRSSGETLMMAMTSKSGLINAREIAAPPAADTSVKAEAFAYPQQQKQDATSTVQKNSPAKISDDFRANTEEAPDARRTDESAELRDWSHASSLPQTESLAAAVNGQPITTAATENEASSSFVAVIFDLCPMESNNPNSLPESNDEPNGLPSNEPANTEKPETSQIPSTPNKTPETKP